MYIFRISGLIRVTLLIFYLSLTLPLPFLANFTHASIPEIVFWVGIALGGVALWAALSQRVILDEEKIQVSYPMKWIQFFFRSGWCLSWQEIKSLKMRTTGQGGLVYYFVSKAEDKAYLLPMRVAGFSKMVQLITEKTGIDTTDIRPLAQAWMYLILLILTGFLGLIDLWIIWQATF